MSAALQIRQVAQVSLFVRDMERAVAFYRDTLGLPHLFTAGDLAFLDAAGVRLYLHACGADDWRPGSILYFAVDDIGESFAALQAAGVTTQGEPHCVHIDEQTGMAEWMGFFDDSEGNTLGLISRVPR